MSSTNPKIIRSSPIGLLTAIFFTIVFVMGNLKDTPLYAKYQDYTKFIFQTLGFEQRWGMYGYDYTITTMTRYVYEFSDGESQTVYPRYWRQGEFNPYRYVKTEDFQWYFYDTPDHRDLMTRVMSYYCRSPHREVQKVPTAIKFQYTKALFPSLYNPESIYDPKRFSPDFTTALHVRCAGR